MTQVRLAIELGVSQETINGYEIGKAVPPADMLVKLANVLDTSVDYILGRTNDKKFIKLLKSDLSNQEQEIITIFRKLSPNKKERFLGYMDGLSEK